MIINWYKKAGRGIIPRMEMTEEERKPTILTKTYPYLGTNDRETLDGKGYPKGTSSQDKYDDNYTPSKNILPSGRTLLDDDIPTGEGANDDRFSDPIDKMPHKDPDPVGPHNMQRGGVFRNVARHTKVKSLNRI